jgi:hypothetical protein
MATSSAMTGRIDAYVSIDGSKFAVHHTIDNSSNSNQAA